MWMPLANFFEVFNPLFSESIIYTDEIRSTPVNEVYKRMMLYKKRAKMVRGSVLLNDFK